MNVALAFLEHGGRVRQVCVGCSEILYEQGILTLVIEETMPRLVGDDAVQRVYRIASPFTIDECRAAISARHNGPLWGS